MAKRKEVTTPTTEITTIDWLNHFSQTASNLSSRQAVTASNKSLSIERVSMIQRYNTDHALLIDHLSLSMAVFGGSKAAKQSLKRSLGLAMVKASKEKYSLQFTGDNCTVVGATIKVTRDKVQDAWDTLGESVPAHVVEAMQALHSKAATALRNATKELRVKADAAAQEDKIQRAKSLLTVKGQEVTEQAVNTIVACMD